MRSVTVSIAIFALSHSVAHPEEFRVTGRVFGVDGARLQQAMVSPYWSANNSLTKSDGTPYDLTDKQEHDEFWGTIGNMQPMQTPVETGPDGEFAISLRRKRHLLVMDSGRKYGSLLPLQDDIAEFHLQPLITVRGQLKSTVTGRPASWSHVSVELPTDPERPLFSRKVVLCGTVDGKFEFRIPPGKYLLNCYGRSIADDDETFLAVSPSPNLLVNGKHKEIDLGVLELTLAPPDGGALRRRAKESGRWRDYKEHYGEPAPEWHAVDARGITTQTKIKDFRGKWLLIYFWGYGCVPCLETGIPSKIEFYHKHANDRNRFELVGVCIDHRGEFRNLKALDAALAPIVAHVWKGREIPFPLALDDSFKTWERYGIPGLGTAVLIDPRGNLVEGNASTLAELLKRPVGPSSDK